jgi:succinate-semialdehyde dehydrogenase/glutarate-semialdehyde dehydrogenase
MLTTTARDSGRRIQVLNPATGAPVGSVEDATRADVVAVIDRAAIAAASWREVPAIARAHLLRAAGELMLDRRGHIADVLTSEQGKPLKEAEAEVVYAAGFLDWFAGEAERCYGQVISAPDAAKRILVLRQPVGVTAAITPWNFPAAMLTRKLGPAVAAGCSCIAKPAGQTPLTAIEVCKALRDAGAPDGLVSVVTSSEPAMVADALLGDPRVRKLSFTGSTEVGRDLIRRSARHITRLSLELGGHAPYIVFADADLESAVDGYMASKFRNAGQTCICANRLYVHDDIHDTFVDRLVARTKGLRVGPGTAPGTDIGPLIDDAAVAKVARHVEDAIDHGAGLLLGGRRDEQLGGQFFAPTILDGVTSEMLLAREETFGPVAGLTTFTTEAEVLQVANATPYGLAAYVHTRDYARLIRMAERLEFGVVGANDGAPSTPVAPFGGLKASGYGREGGSVGIDEFMDIKYVSIGGVA